MSKKKEFTDKKPNLVQNILLLGATGYVGGALCRKFAQTGDLAVLALVRPSSQIEAIEPFCKEIIRSQKAEFSLKEVEEIIRKHEIKTVINLAWNMPPASTKEAQFAQDRIALEAALDGASSTLVLSN